VCKSRFSLDAATAAWADQATRLGPTAACILAPESHERRQLFAANRRRPTILLAIFLPVFLGQRYIALCRRGLSSSAENLRRERLGCIREQRNRAMWCEQVSKVGMRGALQAAHSRIGFSLALIAAIAIAQARSAHGETPTSDSDSSPSYGTGARHAEKLKRESKAEKIAKAEQLVKDSLYHEIAGSDADREKTLAAARELAPDHKPVMWQSGMVEVNNRWTKIDDVPVLANRDSGLGAYEKQRDRAADSLAGQLNLARWCANRGMMEQSRAHYTRALEFDADNAEARAALGFRRVGNNWVARPELDEMVAEAQRLTKSLNRWLPKATQIRTGLVDAGPGRDTAKKQLAEIHDLEAAPALEYVLSGVTEECATQLVEKLGEWSDISATQALVRQSVYSPWESVRQLAATKLMARPREDFVPKMLAAMYTPLQMKTVVFNDRGRLVTREVYAREGKNAWEVVMLDTAYVRIQRARNDGTETLNRAVGEMRRNVEFDQQLAAMQSANTEQLNNRVMLALSIATQQSTLLRPEDWWSWWDNQSETTYTSEKATTRRTEERTVYVQDLSMPEPASTPIQRSSTTPRSATAECFAAGTPVTTVRGSVPIEQIRVGDLVLSQDVETGELAYKPVLRTTIRMPEPVFTIESSGNTLRSTGGHLFWVSGEGWTKARNLQPGQSLHCATGTVQVSTISDSAPERTYNLVVADFATYFVGKEKILSHDVTEKKTTHSIVPGLARVE
jgi:hypothetical protein